MLDLDIIRSTLAKRETPCLFIVWRMVNCLRFELFRGERKSQFEISEFFWFVIFCFRYYKYKLCKRGIFMTSEARAGKWWQIWAQLGWLATNGTSQNCLTSLFSSFFFFGGGGYQYWPPPPTPWLFSYF